MKNRGYPMPENHVCYEIGRLNFQGNIIPHSWYDHIKREPVKRDDRSRPIERTEPLTDSIAILILAEIVYWYRPIEILDEQTGNSLGWHKRFAADLLQLSYEAIGNKLGLTKNQVRRATDNLERLELITKQFRTVRTSRGGDTLILNNVLYIGLNPQRLAEISFPVPPIQFKLDRVSNLNSIQIQRLHPISTDGESDGEVGELRVGVEETEAVPLRGLNSPIGEFDTANNDSFSSSSSSETIEKPPEIEQFEQIAGYIPAPEQWSDVVAIIGGGPKNGEYFNRLSLELYRGNVNVKKNRAVSWLENDTYYIPDHEREFLQIPPQHDFSACGGVSRHPAIMAFKTVVGHWPCKQLYGRVANRWDGYDYDYLVGEFTTRRAGWLEHGYSKTAYGWLFDLFPAFESRAIKQPLEDVR